MHTHVPLSLSSMVCTGHRVAKLTLNNNGYFWCRVVLLDLFQRISNHERFPRPLTLNNELKNHIQIAFLCCYIHELNMVQFFLAQLV